MVLAFAVLGTTTVHASETDETGWLLVLNGTGEVQGVNLHSGTESVTIRVPDTIALAAERLAPVGRDGYVLLEQGHLMPLVRAPLPPSARWNPEEVIVDARWDARKQGVWLLTRGGRVFFQQGLSRKPIPFHLPRGRKWKRIHVGSATERHLFLDEIGGLVTLQNGVVIHRTGHRGAVAASLVPGVSEVVVACADGRIYRGDPWRSELGLERIAEATPVVDMAVLPDGTVYLLDAHGAVHDADGQPVPGFIRQDLPLAKALAFTHFEGDPPVWLPPAWRTQLRLSPANVTMAADPYPPTDRGSANSSRGRPVTSSGQVEVLMTGAEEISGWIAEFQFSPDGLTILEEEVQGGAWWEAVPGAQVHASVIAEQGVLRLQGGSAAQPGSGATGDGVLATIRLRPRNSNQGFSKLKLIEATVSHTSLPLHFRPVGEPQAILVRSGSRSRNMSLVWGDDLDLETSRSRRFQGGELIETAIGIEKGANLRRLEVTLSYDPDILQPVVSHPGSCWRGRGSVDFRDYVRPGGRYKCVVQTGESDESEIGGEVLRVVWRARTASPTETEISIHSDTKVFSASAPQPTRLRIEREPLVIDLR